MLIIMMPNNLIEFIQMKRLEVWLQELYKTKSTFFHTLTQVDYEATRDQLTPLAHMIYCK